MALNIKLNVEIHTEKAQTSINNLRKTFERFDNLVHLTQAISG